MSYMKGNIGKGHTIYKPVHFEKFLDREGYAVCRSSWEDAFCKWCDHNPNVLKWGSESFHVLYHHPFKRDNNGLPKRARYFPDFYMEIRDVNDVVQKYVIEIKPFKQCSQPVNTARKKKSTYIREQQDWKVNTAKWQSARNFCAKRGYLFKILHEGHLFGKKV